MQGKSEACGHPPAGIHGSKEPVQVIREGNKVAVSVPNPLSQQTK